MIPVLIVAMCTDEALRRVADVLHSGCVEDLPGLDAIQHRVVHIPVDWWVSDGDREHIAGTIRSGW